MIGKQCVARFLQATAAVLVVAVTAVLPVAVTASAVSQQVGVQQVVAQGSGDTNPWD